MADAIHFGWVPPPPRVAVRYRPRGFTYDIARNTAGDWTNASERAEALLLSMLTEEQALDWQFRGYFDVRGSRGTWWRIWSRGTSGNIEELPGDGLGYCAHPIATLPSADVYLAQMLAIVTDEDEFRRVANRFNGWGIRLIAAAGG